MDLRHRSAASTWDWGVAERRWFGTNVAAAVLLFLAGQAEPAGQAQDKTAEGTTRVLDVRVTFESKPVEGASVVAIDGENHIQALTDRDGKAQLRPSADRKVNGIVALHPKLGVAGHWSRARTVLAPPGTVLPLSLAPAKPQTFRVVDGNGQAVRVVPLVVSGFSTSTSGSTPTGALEAARVHTNLRGEATVSWIPRDVRRLDVEIFDDRWKIDQINPSLSEHGLTKIKVCRLSAVDGRLSMPRGVSGEGLLITGTGSDRNGMSLSHHPSARVRRDGTFTLYVATDHVYWLQVVDSEWGSDAWTGIILPHDKVAPAELKLAAYPATRLLVRVTRGPRHEPVAGACINVTSGEHFLYGGRQLGSGGTETALYTVRDGRARFAVGKGMHSICLAAGDWKETQRAEVTSSEPVSVDFYRPWAENREISGRLTREHQPHEAGPAMIVRAWNTTDPEVTRDATVLPDGRFTVRIDAPDIYLMAIDSKEHLSAARRLDPKSSTANLELIPMGSLSGMVVDSKAKPLAGHAVELLPTAEAAGVSFAEDVDKNGNPLPGHTVRMDCGGADFGMVRVVLQSARCDDRGRFKIDSVPAQMRVRVVAGTPADARGAPFSLWPDGFLVDSSLDVYFNPGEARENVRLVAQSEKSEPRAAARAKPEPLEQRLKRAMEHARLNGMRVLVILPGDSSNSVDDLTESLLDAGEPDSIVRYELVGVDSEEVTSQAAFISRVGWDRPQAGEVGLIAIDGTGAKIAAQRIRVDGTAATKRRAAEFINRHAPASRDALALLATAQRAARNTGKRLWIIESDRGCRCTPCSDLARWMHDQRALLGKDYVELWLFQHDDHCHEAMEKFYPDDNQSRDGGTPWFAIAEPDGKVLATSDGPLGNIGLPSSFEEKRHLKRMLDRTAKRLTPAERQRLIDSLTERNQ